MIMKTNSTSGCHRQGWTGWAEEHMPTRRGGLPSKYSAPIGQSHFRIWNRNTIGQEKHTHAGPVQWTNQMWPRVCQVPASVPEVYEPLQTLHHEMNAVRADQHRVALAFFPSSIKSQIREAVGWRAAGTQEGMVWWSHTLKPRADIRDHPSAHHPSTNLQKEIQRGKATCARWNRQIGEVGKLRGWWSSECRQRQTERQRLRKG